MAGPFPTSPINLDLHTTDGGTVYEYRSDHDRWVIYKDSTNVTDSDAIHDNVANEITAITPKTSLVDADELLTEDSAASFVKKAITFGNLKSSISDLHSEAHTLNSHSTPHNITERVILSNTEDVNLTGISGALIVGGDGTGAHIAIDGNEIMAKANATTAATLNLQINGGTVAIGGGKITGIGASTTDGDAVRHQDTRLTNSRTPTQHALDSATYHTINVNTTFNATTTKHGFLKQLNNSATQYMNGQGNWGTPSGEADYDGDLMIGSGNAEWVPCINAGHTSGASGHPWWRFNGTEYINTGSNNPSISFTFPLPTNRGGKSLRIIGSRPQISDSDSSNYLLQINVYGETYAVRTAIPNGSINHSSVHGTGTPSSVSDFDNLWSTVNMSGYQTVLIYCLIVATTDSAFGMKPPLLKVYYE